MNRSELASDHASDRKAALLRLADQPAFDVLIVGGGINGAATFRELALQGVRVLLVDREDFGAGASSASTRMAHGGLRYLENGEVRLVVEATRERNRLMRNAPHAVVPLQVTIPCFSVMGGLIRSIGKLLGVRRPIPSRGLVLLKIGLSLYDFYGSRLKVMPSHRMTSRATTLQELPRLHPAIRGAASYYDAKVIAPERVAFELVLDGLAANPACVAINHCRAERSEGGSVVLRDLLDDRELALTPRLVINAGGAWIDEVNARIAPGAALIGGTKGSHLVIDCPALRDALAGRAFSFDDGMGRMCVVYPIGDMVLLGSTDLRVTDADSAVCTEEEVDYLLGAIRLVFPMVEVLREQIRYRFCGVRPLPRSTSRDTVDISRDHSIARRAPDADTPFTVLSLVGGKWTTFRAFAEQVTDQVLADLGMPRKERTEDLAIGGGRDYPHGADARQRWMDEVSGISGLPPARVGLLLDRYGTRARDVALFCGEAADRPLADAPEYTEREIRFLVEREMAVTIDDVIYRRTTLAMWGRLTFPLLCDLARIIADATGADEAALLGDAVRHLRRHSAIDYTAELERRHAPATAVA